MEIERLSKDKVMRPSLIDSVDKINEVIDTVESIDNIVETIEHSAILTRTTTGEANGALISVTANGHAEQDGTPTPSDPKEIVVVRGHEVTGKTGRYVDLVVTADGTTTTPIPLPSRGWVGSLPDGTHDALLIDGAGKVTWEVRTAEKVFDGSAMSRTDSDLSAWFYTGVPDAISTTAYYANVLATHFTRGFSPVMTNRVWLIYKQVHFKPDESTVPSGNTASGLAEFKAWLADNPVTVLYPLATPTTVDVGYVDLPDIPDGAVVSIPELEKLGVESWNNDTVYRYVNALVTRVTQ